MPATKTLRELQDAADQAHAALSAAQQRIAEARAEVHAAANAHRDAVIAATQPQPIVPVDSSAKGKPATTPAAMPSVDATDARLKKALGTYQAVCKELGI